MKMRLNKHTHIDDKGAKYYCLLTYRPFISSVGQSVQPHGCSVAPTIKPNIKPNTNEINIPVPRAAKPFFYGIF